MKRHNWVSYQEVKAKIPILLVLDRYGIKIRGTGENLRGKCPLHDGDGDRSLSVNPSKGLFFCFSCKKGGNILDLVSQLEDVTVREAALQLQESFLIGKQPQPAPDQPEPPTEEPSGEINPPLGFSLQVDPEHEFGQSRGISSSTFKYLGAGYCLSRGLFAGRFVFPLHNERGDLVGYVGRTVDGSDPKYLLPRGLQKSRLLFNFHREVQEQPEEVILVEGYFGCARVKELGFPCVALMGSQLSERQEELLGEYFKRVVICLDGDEAGCSGRDDTLKRLGRRMFVRAVDLPEGEQPDTVSREDLVMLLMKRSGST